MRTTLIQSAKFGAVGNAAALQGAGWSLPEDGFTWTDGRRAEITVADRGLMLLEVAVRPYLPPGRTHQTMHVKAGGVVVGSATVTRWATLGFILPHGGQVEFVMPDATRPCDVGSSQDTRALSFSFLALNVYSIGRYEAPPPLPTRPANILAAFESIGDNCEFGLVQRAAKIEPLGLLRFAGMPLWLLVEAFSDQFARLDITVKLHEGEFGVWVHPYNMWYHTFATPEQTTLEAVQAQQVKTAAFLRRKFLGDIEAGEKVLVYKRNTYLGMAEILPMFAALWRIGPVNLLIGRPADGTNKAGTVEALMPGLFAGYFETFGEYGRPHVTRDMLAAWEAVCSRLLELGGDHCTI